MPLSPHGRAARIQPGPVYRRLAYTSLSGRANKVSYIGYGGGRCREHNTDSPVTTAPCAPVFFVNSRSYFANQEKHRRLYEKRSSLSGISIGRERRSFDVGLRRASRVPADYTRAESAPGDRGEGGGTVRWSHLISSKIVFMRFARFLSLHESLRSEKHVGTCIR